MGQLEKPKLSPVEREKERINRYVRFYHANKIFRDELFFSILDSYFYMPTDYWDSCAAEMPQALIPPFIEYLDTNLGDDDFCKKVAAFFATSESAERGINAMLNELQPRLVAIRQFWSARKAATDAG